MEDERHVYHNEQIVSEYIHADIPIYLYGR